MPLGGVRERERLGLLSASTMETGERVHLRTVVLMHRPPVLPLAVAATVVVRAVAATVAIVVGVTVVTLANVETASTLSCIAVTKAAPYSPN